MATPPRAPAPLAHADLSRVQAVLTDVDGTLTRRDRIQSSTLQSLERLQGAGLKVGLVSGRPAGWGECWVRQWPVDLVIIENGGLAFVREEDGSVRKVYAQPKAVRQRARQRLVQEVERAMRQVPGARLSSDSAYTEVDIAIDYNEEVHLGVEAAQRLEQILRARRVQAVRSSVHVNCWIGRFDKRTTAMRLLTKEWGIEEAQARRQVVYVGDSFNDAPMFAAFPLSVGVANVRPLLGSIAHAPAFIAEGEEADGFREVAEAILTHRNERRIVRKQG